MKDFFTHLFIDLKKGENLDLVITFAVGIVVSILNLFAITSTNHINSIILATLGLFSAAHLVTRYKLESLYKEDEIENTVELLKFSPPKLKDLFEKSDEIWMLGLTLRNTTMGNYYQFKSRCSKDLKLRVVLVDLERVDLPIVLQRFSRAGSENSFVSDMHQVINQYKEICNCAEEKSRIQLSLINFVPSFSLFVFPKEANNGIIFIENYCFKSQQGSIPKFFIEERMQPEWYEHFYDQFLFIWKYAKQVNLCEN